MTITTSTTTTTTTVNITSITSTCRNNNPTPTYPLPPTPSPPPPPYVTAPHPLVVVSTDAVNTDVELRSWITGDVPQPPIVTAIVKRTLTSLLVATMKRMRRRRGRGMRRRRRLVIREETRCHHLVRRPMITITIGYRSTVSVGGGATGISVKFTRYTYSIVNDIVLV